MWFFKLLLLLTLLASWLPKEGHSLVIMESPVSIDYEQEEAEEEEEAEEMAA